jgi:hypothetical protein
VTTKLSQSRVGEDLHPVPVVQRGLQRHELAVDPRSGALVSQFRVDLVGEVQGGRPPGERQHLALGSEDVDLVGIEVDLESRQKGPRVPDLLLPLEQLAQPQDVGILALPIALALLVPPVGGDALLGDQIHLPGADLDLEGLPRLAHHGGVEGLVEVGLGHGDVVLEPARNRAPALVHHAKGGVGVLQILGDDAERQVVVELGDVDPLPLELLVDRVIPFDAERELGLEPRRLQGFGEPSTDVLRGLPSQLELLRELGVQLGVCGGVEIVEGQVFQVALDPGHAETVGDGGVDGEGLARDAAPCLRSQVDQGLHVVETVGQLDQDYPHVASGGEDQLAKALRLGLVPGNILVAPDLGHPVDQLRHFLAKPPGQLLPGGQRVFQHIVEQPDGHAGGVELEIGEQPGHRQRVDHVGFPGPPALVAVHLGREIEDRPQQLLVEGPAVGGQPLQHVLQPLHRRCRYRR